MPAAARPRPVAIDTDPGIDDALALLLALRSPELRVELITTVAGNVPVPVATANARRILALLALPVLGSLLPLARWTFCAGARSLLRLLLQRRQQCDPQLHRMAARVTRRLGHRLIPPLLQHPRRDAGKQVARQPDRGDSL